MESFSFPPFSISAHNLFLNLCNLPFRGRLVVLAMSRIRPRNRQLQALQSGQRPRAEKGEEHFRIKRSIIARSLARLSVTMRGKPVHFRCLKFSLKCGQTPAAKNATNPSIERAKPKLSHTGGPTCLHSQTRSARTIHRQPTTVSRLGIKSFPSCLGPEFSRPHALSAQSFASSHTLVAIAAAKPTEERKRRMRER